MDAFDFVVYKKHVKYCLANDDWSRLPTKNVHLNIRQLDEILDIMNQSKEGILIFQRLMYTDGFHTPKRDAIQKTVTYNTLEGYSEYLGERFDTMKVWICPACKDHEYGSISVYHDCKNEFVEPIFNDELKIWQVKTVGQCQCSGKDHGRRKR